MKKRLLQTMALVFVGLLTVWTMGLLDGELSDEDQIRQIINDIAEGAENADMTRVMEPISEKYSDNEGIDRRGIYGIFWSQFRKRGPISVWLSAIDVTVNGPTATANFDAGLAEGAEGQMIGWPVNVDALTFSVNLEKESDWKVTSHTRRPAWELENSD